MDFSYHCVRFKIKCILEIHILLIVSLNMDKERYRLTNHTLATGLLGYEEFKWIVGILGLTGTYSSKLGEETADSLCDKP